MHNLNPNPKIYIKKSNCNTWDVNVYFSCNRVANRNHLRHSTRIHSLIPDITVISIIFVHILNININLDIHVHENFIRWYNKSFSIFFKCTFSHHFLYLLKILGHRLNYFLSSNTKNPSHTYFSSYVQWKIYTRNIPPSQFPKNFVESLSHYKFSLASLLSCRSKINVYHWLITNPKTQINEFTNHHL